VGMCKQINIL